ncbi:MAG TPA: hypothetical protein VFV60_07590 [bacterium]|nr:hypothetical protein [bacterium]
MQGKRGNVFWPVIEDAASARRTALQGAWAAGLSAVATIIIMVGQIGTRAWLAAESGRDAHPVGMSPLAIVDVGIFVLIAFGIYKMSRFAAVAGLALYLLERVRLFQETRAAPNVLAIVFTLMFINSIRGTYAYRKLTHGAGVDTEGSELSARR